MVFVIAFEGVDLAGKTTLIDRLLAKCDKVGVKAAKFESKGSTVSDLLLETFRKGNGIGRSCIFMSYTLQRLAKAFRYEQMTYTVDFIFMDRSYYTNLAYGRILGEPETAKHLAEIEKKVFLIDHVVHCTIDKKTYKRRLKKSKDSHIWESQVDMMMDIDAAYDVIFSGCKSTIVDSQQSIRNSVDYVYDKLIAPTIKK